MASGTSELLCSVHLGAPLPELWGQWLLSSTSAGSASRTGLGINTLKCWAGRQASIDSVLTSGFGLCPQTQYEKMEFSGEAPGFWSKEIRGQRDNSVLNTGCFCRGPRFSSQHPHDASQPSIAPVPRTWTPSSGLHWHQAGMCAQTYSKAKIHTNQIKPNQIRNQCSVVPK